MKHRLDRFIHWNPSWEGWGRSRREARAAKRRWTLHYPDADNTCSCGATLSAAKRQKTTCSWASKKVVLILVSGVRELFAFRKSDTCSAQ